VISRVASSCFWLHRYLERAENMARMLRVNRSFVLDIPVSEIEKHYPLIIVSGEQERFDARFRASERHDRDVVEEYLSIGAELNVLPFTTAILPPEIVDAPVLGSLCFHPSLLPAYRGGNALAWQVILGAEETGVTVFQPDAGVDTGPIVVQKGGVRIGPTDTGASYYFDHLYAMGVDAIAEAVEQVTTGTAKPVAQTEDGASFQGLVDDTVARIDWTRPGEELDRLVRGCDPQPGAWAELDRVPVRLYGQVLERSAHGKPPGTVLEPDTAAGRVRIATADDCVLTVAKLKVGDAKKAPALEAGLAQGQRLA